MQKKCLGARGARVRVGLAFDARTARTGGVYGGAPCRACAAPPCVFSVFAPSLLRLLSAQHIKNVKSADGSGFFCIFAPV